MIKYKDGDKLEACKREELKIGDVVYADDEPDLFGVVTWIKGRVLYVMWDDGSCGSETKIEEIHKTGKNIKDKIQSVLSEIGKEERWRD